MPTKIEWTDQTLSFATGCSRISPGCDHCYMMAMYPRLKSMGAKGYEADAETVTLIPDRILQPLKVKKPTMWFINSMSDSFHKAVPFWMVRSLLSVAQETPQHTYQLLTKRPGRAAYFWNEYGHLFPDGWPPNVWLGTSVESQKYAPRITVLARVPAPVRFVSAEPLLERLNLREHLGNGDLQWVIGGGESGPGARPASSYLFSDLRNQCEAYGVPYFLKQLGGVRDKRGGDKALLDGELWHQMPEVR